MPYLTNVLLCLVLFLISTLLSTINNDLHCFCTAPLLLHHCEWFSAVDHNEDSLLTSSFAEAAEAAEAADEATTSYGDRPLSEVFKSMLTNSTVNDELYGTDRSSTDTTGISSLPEPDDFPCTLADLMTPEKLHPPPSTFSFQPQPRSAAVPPTTSTNEPPVTVQTMNTLIRQLDRHFEANIQLMERVVATEERLAVGWPAVPPGFTQTMNDLLSQIDRHFETNTQLMARIVSTEESLVTRESTMFSFCVIFKYFNIICSGGKLNRFRFALSLLTTVIQ